MGTVFKTMGTPCKVGCDLGLRAKLARSQIRNERQRNDATLAGFGVLRQQAILGFDRKGKSSKCASVCTLALLAV